MGVFGLRRECGDRAECRKVCGKGWQVQDERAMG